LSVDDLTLNELKRFSKGVFEVEAILANAAELKYTREIKRLLAQEMAEPSEDLVRFFVARVYVGRMTQSVKEQFVEITKKALQQFISERVSDRLKMALEKEEATAVQERSPNASPPVEKGIETTEEEYQGFYIVQAILSQMVDPTRVVMRDQQSYCAVLLDDNNRKPLCRLRFNSAQKYLGLLDGEKNETKIPIGSVVEIYHHTEQLKEALTRYQAGGPRGPEPAGSSAS
ncbi:MAG TPA: restriction endonuclease, partial [Thermoanaerobaculia bacterium]|nr:restriction endonuclease [Thermoanaerobaculia bacterium]